MVLGSPDASARGGFAFWAPGDQGNHEVDVDAFFDQSEGEEGKVVDVIKGRSMYVTEFEDMLKTVLDHESFLFNMNELHCFSAYARLSYEAKYIFVRLCLRKAGKWFRESDLKYQTELGNKIQDAVRELCGYRLVAEHDPIVKVEEPEINWISDDQPIAGPSRLSEKPTLPSCAQDREGDYTVLADDGSKADLRELLDCLKRDELQKLVKDMRLKPSSTTKEAYISVLMSCTSTQTTLHSFATPSKKGKGKAAERPLKQATLDSFMKGCPSTQQGRLREMVMKELGTVLKLNEDVVKLFRRVNIVYFRSTQYSHSLMTAAILARARRRTYAEYTQKRTPNIWETRRALLDYEEALELEVQIDELFNGASNGGARARSRSAASKAPTPASADPGSSPMKKFKGEGDENKRLCIDSDSSREKDSPRIQNAREAKSIFEKIYDRWKALVADEGWIEGRDSGLERFHCGHIFTRIVCKGAYALGILKEFERELEVLEELLKQRRWRRGRRGKWYERRALILMTHMEKEEHVLRRAYDGVWQALADEDTHIVYRPKLRNRLVRLENQLKIPVEERHQCAACLKKAGEVYIQGERIRLIFDSSGRPVESKIKRLHDSKQQVISISESTMIVSRAVVSEPDMKQQAKIPTGKSVWQGCNDEHISVEELALQHYSQIGFKGYHCEGRIITTLFGLLCWDIIFADVNGAFETPYQSAPLDIVEDTFLYSRDKIAKDRFDELRQTGKGEIAKMVEEAFNAHEGKMCVGVRWDLFESTDLMEIAECIGGTGLAIICQLLCEDYAGRTAGVPDLIVWNKTESCKFVEVKGPGDSLQENQKVWIDVLLQADIPTEVCHVVEKGAEKPRKGGKSPTKSKKAMAGTKRKRDELEELEMLGETLAESQDELEQDYSRPDLEVAVVEESYLFQPTRKLTHLPSTPRKVRQVVEVVITTPTPSPRMQFPSLSPEL